MVMMVKIMLYHVFFFSVSSRGGVVKKVRVTDDDTDIDG